MTLTEGVALKVDDIYVPLGLVERKKQPKPQGDISPEQGSELYKETEITKTFEHDAFLEEVLKQKNTPKSQGKRIAIIGEPGAGKTTLLQQIANWVFCEIDLSIVIWVFLADLQGQKLEEYLLKTWLTAAVRKKGKAKPTQQQENDFVALFNQNHVWLLLDGLDEMSASSGNPLTEIARQFRESGLISQARIVLTCRVNLWDGGINALDDFDIYRTLNFSYPEQVEKFIHKWFTANPEAGKQLCTALKEPDKKRIQDLVKNPLRLTLLCFNWQSGDGKLPETQAGLYQRFVDDFYKWKQDEFPTTSHQEQQLNIKLGELAKTAIDKETTRFRLRQYFVTQFLGDADDENSLFKLALNCGWLNQVGIDTNRKPVYAFFHISFQEYFAAKSIDDWHFFLNHVPKNPRKGTYRIFEPQWKQTILLWLGREDVSKEEKEVFIKSLVEFDDKCGNFYDSRAYFIAASGVSEFQDCLLTNKIVNQIVKWHTNKCFEPETRELIQTMPRTKTINYLVNQLLILVADLVNKPETIRFYYLNQLSYIISSLEKIGVGNEVAINALTKLLTSKYVTRNESCLHKVIMALKHVCTSEESNINILLNFLESQGKNRNNLTQVIQKLRIKCKSDKQLIYILVGMIELQDMYDYNRQPEKNLEEVQNEPIFDDLVQLLYSMDDDKLKLAARRLEKIDRSNGEAFETLIEILDLADEYNGIYWLVEENLKQILQPHQVTTVITKFTQSLHNSQSGNHNFYESITWYCAQNMPYPDFYQAWHQQ